MISRRRLLTGAATALAMPHIARATPLCGFSANLGGESQYNCPNLAYTPVVMRTCDINDAGYDLTNNWWIPPASAGIVVMSFNVWIQAHARLPSNIYGDGYNQCAKIHFSTDKGMSWQQLKASPGWEPAGYTNTGASQGAGILGRADGKTAYRLFMYTTSDTGYNDCVIDGNPAHTWFTGFYET